MERSLEFLMSLSPENLIKELHVLKYEMYKNPYIRPTYKDLKTMAKTMNVRLSNKDTKKVDILIVIIKNLKEETLSTVSKPKQCDCMTCMDLFLFDKFKIDCYLQEDKNNIVFIMDDSMCICYSKDYIDTSSENTFYECNIKYRRGKPYFEPELSYKYSFLRLRDPYLVKTNILKKTIAQGIKLNQRIFKLTKDTKIDRLISQNVVDAKPNSAVSGKHCQEYSGALLYRIDYV